MKTNNQIVGFNDEKGILKEKIKMPFSGILSKSFARRHYEKQLLESPTRIPPKTFATDNDVTNFEDSENIITNYSNLKIQNYIYKNRVYGLYLIEKEKDDFYYILIDEKRQYTDGFIRYKYNKYNYFTLNGVWSYIFAQGLISNFMINWVFKHQKLILSSTVTTPSGEGFIKKLIQYCLDNHIETGLFYEEDNKFIPFKQNDDLNIAWSGIGVDKQVYFKTGNKNE